MPLSWIRTILCFAVLAGVFAASKEVLAEESGPWVLQTSIYTIHFRPDPRHINQQKLLHVEYHRTDQWFYAAGSVTSSFGQPVQYVTFGKQWRPIESVPLLHVKLSGGLYHGYKGEFRDKVPFNSSGFAPAILPTIGFSGQHVSGEVVFLGTNALMVAIGVVF
jgi:hypothetical protein